MTELVDVAEARAATRAGVVTPPPYPKRRVRLDIEYDVEANAVGDPIALSNVATGDFEVIPGGIATAAALEEAQAAIDGLSSGVASASSVFIAARDFNLIGPASPVPTATFGAIANRYAAWTMHANEVAWLEAKLRLPSDWTAAWIDPVWTNLMANNGNVSWGAAFAEAAEGENLNVTPTGPPAWTHAADPVPHNLRRSIAATSRACDPSKFTLCRITRNGTSGSDTLENDLAFLGVLLRKG